MPIDPTLLGHAFDDEHGARERPAAANDSADGDLAAVRAELDAIRRTLSWRLTRPLRVVRRLAGRARRVLLATDRGAAPPAPVASSVAPAVDDDVFDVAYYRRANRDLGHLDDEALRGHYKAFGRAEGRRYRPVLQTADVRERDYDPDRPTVLLGLHEATRSGAPVLGWNLVQRLARTYNVVLVLLRGGEIAHAFDEVANVTISLDGGVPPSPYDLEVMALELVDRYHPVYAVANSAATHELATALEEAGVPALVLVHEFASTLRPFGMLNTLVGVASELVFPARIVADAMSLEYAGMLARAPRILPQGQSALPPGQQRSTAQTAGFTRETRYGTDGAAVDLPQTTVEELLPRLDPTTVLVIGAGTLAPRKGVEFFVQAAAELVRQGVGNVTFAWIGHRFTGLEWYVDELHEHVRRSGVGSTVHFLEPADDLVPLYERADLFFLSSRLDPMPNVTIDAALASIPVVAFENASGFAEWLAQAGLPELVVPHLDATAAARVIARLARDGELRARTGETIREAAQRTFDMDRYVAGLDELGLRARRIATQIEADIATIAASGRFEASLFGIPWPGRTGDQLLRQYVVTSARAIPRSAPRTGTLMRRPAAGFHPLVYAEQAAWYDDEDDGDPFADWLRRGEPEGPWSTPILGPDDGGPGVAGTRLRVLVHGHFHYPELLPDLLDRLARNTHPYRLVVTTTSAEKVVLLEKMLADRGSEGTVVLVPNRGRDLGALFTGVDDATLREHDVVLHLHGKKSPHVVEDVADRWRTAIWENLVGGKHAMLDRLVRAFADDPALGLVSQEDPHLNDWDLNREHGEQLAARLGLDVALPNHLDFPVGAMFWARTAAIAPILDLGLAWDDYPEEPLRMDGTSLHALERIVPLVVRSRGFTYAKTVVPGVHR